MKSEGNVGSQSGMGRTQNNKKKYPFVLLFRNGHLTIIELTLFFSPKKPFKKIPNKQKPKISQIDKRKDKLIGWPFLNFLCKWIIRG